MRTVFLISNKDAAICRTEMTNETDSSNELALYSHTALQFSPWVHQRSEGSPCMFLSTFVLLREVRYLTTSCWRNGHGRYLLIGLLSILSVFHFLEANLLNMKPISYR